MTVTKSFRYESVKRLPDSIHCRALEHFVSSPIEQQNPLIVINRYDGVHSGINYSGKSSLTLAQCSFGMRVLKDFRLQLTIGPVQFAGPFLNAFFQFIASPAQSGFHLFAVSDVPQNDCKYLFITHLEF